MHTNHLQTAALVLSAHNREVMARTEETNPKVKLARRPYKDKLRFLARSFPRTEQEFEDLQLFDHDHALMVARAVMEKSDISRPLHFQIAAKENKDWKLDDWTQLRAIYELNVGAIFRPRLRYS